MNIPEKSSNCWPDYQWHWWLSSIGEGWGEFVRGDTTGGVSRVIVTQRTDRRDRKTQNIGQLVTVLPAHDIRRALSGHLFLDFLCKETKVISSPTVLQLIGLKITWYKHKRNYINEINCLGLCPSGDNF